jgi:hypothetical protein
MIISVYPALTAPTPLQWPSLEHQIWTETPSATTWNTRSAAFLPTDA